MFKPGVEHATRDEGYPISFMVWNYPGQDQSLVIENSEDYDNGGVRMSIKDAYRLFELLSRVLDVE